MDLYLVRSLLNSGKSIYDIQLKVTFYARVSTDTQEQLNSLSNQINYYREFICKCPNWEYIDGYYDEGITGTNALKRDNFIKMIADGKKGKFDMIITKEISRFSRNTLDSIRYTQELLVNGVGVLFQNDNINTLHSDSELRLTIMSSIAQDEVRKLSERVRFGLKRSIDDGKVLGNNNIYGYKKENGRLIIDPYEAEIVKRIYELYISGFGIRVIGSKLLEEGITNRDGKEFAYSTIKRIITNPKYKGYYCGNKTHKVAYNIDKINHLDKTQWKIYKDNKNIPIIIDADVWEKANQIYNRRSEQVKNKESSYNNKFAYSKKIFCEQHGTAYYHGVFKNKKGNKNVWKCKKYIEKGLNGCTSPIIYQEDLDNMVRKIIELLSADKNMLVNEILEALKDDSVKNELSKKIQKLKENLSVINKRKDRLLDLSIDGIITEEEFSKRNKIFNNEIDNINFEIDNINTNIKECEKFINSVEKMKNIIAEEINSNIKITYDLIDSLVERIIITKESTYENIYFVVQLFQFTYPLKYELSKEKNGCSIGRFIDNNITSFCSPLHT